MTREEAVRIIRIIKTSFPNWKIDRESISDVADLWAAVLGDIPSEAVKAAYAVYMAEGREFAPNPSQLREIIYRQAHRDDMTEAEAWGLVSKAIRNGIYNAEEEFKNLPELVQKAVGSADYLRNLAMMEDVNWSVESSNFYRRLKTVSERAREEALIPAKIKEVLMIAER